MGRAYLSALVAAIFWGVSFLLTKVALTEMGPMGIAALRWWIAGLVLIGLAMLNNSERDSLRCALQAEWRVFVVLGILGIGLFYVFQNLALIYTTSIDVGLIMNAVPILVAILGVWLLKETFTRRGVAGVLLALMGVTLISIAGMSGVEESAPDRLVGNALALIATVAGALYLVGGKRVVSSYGPLTVTGLVGLMGALLMTPVALWEGVSLVGLSPQVWGALLGLALACSAAAYWLWWYAAERLPVSRVSAFVYVTPLVSTVLGVAVLGEPLGLATAAGAVFVIGGVVLVQA